MLYFIDFVRDENFELNEKDLMSIKFPNEPNSYDEDRERPKKSFWSKEPCMTNGVPGQAKVSGRARAFDVTAESDTNPKVE